MNTLPPEHRERLRATVAAAEKKTSAEIVLAIAEISDDYGHYPLLWAAMTAFLVAAGLAVAEPGMALRPAFSIVGIASLAVAGVLHWLPLCLLVVPDSAKQRAAARFARQQFAQQVAGRTRDRNGLLIFVSLREHYVEMIGDLGIAERISPAAWTDIVADLVRQIGAGDMTSALEVAIGRCINILGEQFPPRADDVNELPDSPVLTGRPVTRP